MAAPAQPQIAQAIVPSTLTKAGSSISGDRADISAAMAVSGTGCAQSFSTEINTFVRNACEMEGIHPLRRWTTSSRKLTAVLTISLIWNQFAAAAIKPRQHANA
ncbi:hypothetical protein ASU93_23545 [Enterobacter hormaechei subsp. steigerwaltii]|nr:hypothetical protein ASU93_23545 [Enterobacter hormaechei subsp. steigerwaltii]